MDAKQSTQRVSKEGCLLRVDQVPRRNPRLQFVSDETSEVVRAPVLAISGKILLKAGSVVGVDPWL